MDIETPAEHEADMPVGLVSRARLILRWQHGSDTFFWRSEKHCLLLPVRDGTLLRYRWTDVFAFEGGPPPAGMDAAYAEDLLTGDDVAARCECGADTILKRAKTGLLPCRKIGRFTMFVPAEVAAWQSRWK